MLDLFFLIFCYLSVFDIKIKGTDKFFFDYMELENTNCIKGIFVWLIVFSHKKNYIKNPKYLYIQIIRYLGQNIVSMFFFYSSFGICESIKKKGFIYIKTLKNKLIILFLKAQIIIFIYLIVNIIILKKKISLKVYFLSIIFKLSLGNSNWFAFTIIIFYFYSYLSFSFSKNKILLGIIIISLICFLHVKFVFSYFYPKKVYAIDTVICFVFGFYFSIMKKHLDKIIMKNDIFYFWILSMTILSFYELSKINTLFFLTIKNAFFTFLVVLVTMKLKIKNDFLKFLNSHSYSIYLLQRLIMWIVCVKKIIIYSDFVQIFFEFSSLFCFASLFDNYTSFLNKFFNKKTNDFSKSNYIQIDNMNNIHCNDKNIIIFSKK